MWVGGRKELGGGDGRGSLLMEASKWSREKEGCRSNSYTLKLATTLERFVTPAVTSFEVLIWA